MKPNEVLESTTAAVRDVIDKILSLEKANQSFDNLANVRQKDAEVIEGIIKIIHQGTK